MHAHEMNTFPTSLSISPVIVSTVYFHLTPSSFKRTTSFSALAILFLDLSISNSNYSLSSYIFQHSASSFATADLTASTQSNFTLSSAVAYSRICFTSAYFAFLGATFFVTIQNFELAVAQVHNAAADCETYLTSTGSKPGFEIHPSLAFFQVFSVVSSTL